MACKALKRTIYLLRSNNDSTMFSNYTPITYSVGGSDVNS